MTTYPLAKLIQKPARPYVPSWLQDANSLKETFARARRSVGKQTRVRVEAEKPLRHVGSFDMTLRRVKVENISAKVVDAD